jgi:hypothetical protein
VHAGAIYLPRLGIEDLAAVIVETGSLHLLNEDQPEKRLVTLLARTFRTDRVGVVVKPQIQVREPAYVNAVLLGNGDQGAHVSVVADLLPNAGRGRCLRRADNRLYQEERANDSEDEDRKLLSHGRFLDPYATT